MAAVLFVSNGHGEAAIAARIAAAVRGLDARLTTEHLALVGKGNGGAEFADAGPQRTMPSGGLIAMGNVRNIARDLRAGLAVLTVRQSVFLRRAGHRYRCVVAVGDAFALAVALIARRPALFVGTAKSVHVAPYGPLERRILRAAREVFVRDAATARALADHGLVAAAPGNVIMDLLAEGANFAWPSAERVAVLPGSRPAAYDDAPLLARVIRDAAAIRPQLSAALSVAPQLEAERFATACEEAGFEVRRSSDPERPFDGYAFGRLIVRAWRGPLGSLLREATVALGQAGTANEAAAGNGIPVVALARGRRTGWYRMRQARLLGDALVVASEHSAASEVAALLGDPDRRSAMGRVGRERMGPPGGATAIARRIVACA